jgi:hypothetical protein
MLISFKALKTLLNGQSYFPILGYSFDGGWFSCHCCGFVYSKVLLSLRRILAGLFQFPIRHLCLVRHVANVFLLKKVSRRLQHILNLKSNSSTSVFSSALWFSGVGTISRTITSRVRFEQLSSSMASGVRSLSVHQCLLQRHFLFSRITVLLRYLQCTHSTRSVPSSRNDVF